MNPVETALLENIDNPNFLFIFPTDIAASQWADHILRLKGGVKNVFPFSPCPNWNPQRYAMKKW